LRPYEEAGRQHRHHADGREDGEPPLELLVFRFVFGEPRLVVPITPHRIRHEQIETDEGDARHPERDDDGIVHRFPILGDGREPPRAREMEDEGSDDQQDQNNCHYHLRGPLLVCPSETCQSARSSCWPAECSPRSWWV